MSEDNVVMYAAIGERYNEGYDIAFKTWLQYHILTEMFDRLLPGYYSNNNEWIPIDKSASCLHAKNMREEVINKLYNFCDKQTIERARVEASKINYIDAMKIYLNDQCVKGPKWRNYLI